MPGNNTPPSSAFLKLLSLFTDPSSILCLQLLKSLSKLKLYHWPKKPLFHVNHVIKRSLTCVSPAQVGRVIDASAPRVTVLLPKLRTKQAKRGNAGHLQIHCSHFGFKSTGVFS